MSTFIKNLKTPIAIVGMGKSGEATRSLLLLSGIEPHSIFTFDAKLPSADFNDPHVLMAQKNPQTLVVSPGVPLSSGWIQEAFHQGVKVTSEISLACSCLDDEKIIGVTGSVGKSTTVSLIGAGLQTFSPEGFVGGNLGTPFAQYIIDVLQKKRRRTDWIVLELSSYQLENCENLKLEFGAITFLTSNHLERYESLQDYYKTKWKIISITEKSVFLNKNGGDLAGYAEQNPTSKLRLVSREDTAMKALHLEEAQLIGNHNQDNLALAASLALAARWPISSINGMKSFQGLDHRLENAGTFKGVRFINDSKATAIDSVLIATQAAYDTKGAENRMFVLLGGRNKSLPWEDLKALQTLEGSSFVFFGECREIAQSKSHLPGPSFPHLAEALEHTLAQVKSGDTVLLSPGGTSLDEFKSFEERGNFFKERIRLFAEA